MFNVTNLEISLITKEKANISSCILLGFLRKEHNMLFSERMALFERLKGKAPAGCPDIQAPALSSTFNEVFFVLVMNVTIFLAADSMWGF